MTNRPNISLFFNSRPRLVIIPHFFAFLCVFALGMAAAERFGLARRLHFAGAGSARLNGKIAALQFMFQFLFGRNFITQQPDPAGGSFCGLAEPGNAQGMLDSRLRGNDEEDCARMTREGLLRRGSSGALDDLAKDLYFAGNGN